MFWREVAKAFYKKYFLIFCFTLIFWFFIPNVCRAENVLFQDDFNDGNADGWEVVSGSQENWRVENGKYIVHVEGYDSNSGSVAGDINWDDYIFEVEVMGIEGIDKAIEFRYVDENNMYRINLRSFVIGAKDLVLTKIENGQDEILKNINFYNLLNKWYRFKIVVKNNNIKIYIDDELLIDYDDIGSALTHGKIGLLGWGGMREIDTVAYDNVLVYKEETKKEPVILIPGIMGSLAVDGELVLDPIFHTYDQLYENLQIYGGYKDGETLFSFPYNWMLSNTTTAYLLKNKIKEVKSICDCDKVDLVAHSMGGLVARYYIESDLYQDDVDQMIFLAVPHIGSPKSYLAWEGGDLGPKLKDSIQELFLNQLAKIKGFDNLYDYIRNLPIFSVQQLLPIYDYLQDKDTGLSRSYPNNYPVNEFLENLNLENNLNKLYDKVEIVNIYGELENEGIDKIRVVPRKPSQAPLWEYGYPENYGWWIGDRGLIMADGDETVPVKSAIAIEADKSVDLPIDHKNLVSYSSSEVIDTLLDKRIDITVQDQPEEYIIIQVYSPVDFLVIAPDNKRIGKDFEQNIAINEIEGAFYSGFDAEAEFVVIPNPLEGEYQVQTIGLEQGSYQLDVNYIDTEQEIGASQSFSADVIPNRIDNFNIKCNPDNPEEPIGDLIPDDTVAPEIIINSPEEKEYLHSEIIPIDFQITDDFTGVATTTIQLDSQEFLDNQIDLFFYHLGEHIFKIQVQDKAGNSSEKEIKFKIIATIESLISDIKRCYQEGWIKNEKIKDSLIRDVKKAQKWYNNLEKVKEKIKNPKAKEKISEIQIRIILKSFKIRLKILLKRGLINQHAYDLLLEQANYIINNLN